MKELKKEWKFCQMASGNGL